MSECLETVGTTESMFYIGLIVISVDVYYTYTVISILKLLSSHPHSVGPSFIPSEFIGTGKFCLFAVGFQLIGLNYFSCNRVIG